MYIRNLLFRRKIGIIESLIAIGTAGMAQLGMWEGEGVILPYTQRKKMRVDHEIKIRWSKWGSVVLVLSEISNFKKKI